MKKTLLAAALIAGFASVAQAETSVTLYGIIDTGIGYTQVKGTDANGNNYKSSKFGLVNGQQSGSRWGLKGSEDLGDGLHAVFQLESGFDSSTGMSAQGGRLFGRQATIGLAGDSWGRFDLGRQTNIASKWGYVFDPFAAGWGQANFGNSFSAANTLRYDNMAMYQSPNFSGFQFGAGYSFNANGSQNWNYTNPVTGINQNDSNERAITTGLMYANGPIAALVTYDNLNVGSNGPGNTTGSSVNVSEWMLAGSYDFQIVKASLAFGQTRNGWFAGQGYDQNYTTPTLAAAQGLRVNSYLVGLTAPIGAGSLLASFQLADPTSSPDASATDLSKMQTYSLGYTYNLSKRTNLYVVGSYATHADFQNDLKATFGEVGIRHQF